jgi:protein-S-isoprenylcysteine O-methyltransferase Ste14
MIMPQSPWWKGSRGEWYVVMQIALILFVLFGPRTAFDLPAWSSPYAQLASISGGILVLIGASLFLAGIFKLGANLTPVPYPKDQATLIETGPYRIVRHPIYGGGVVMAFGWAFWVHGWCTVVYAIVLFAFLDIKARREEEWLKQKFPAYTGYQKRVRKLIPFVY